MFQTFLGVLIIALSLALGFAQDEKFSPQVTYENVPYGNHPHQVIDFWKAEAKDPAPLVVFIHGGGFRGGSHDKVNPRAIKKYLDTGIHYVSIEYRFLQHARFPAPHEDCIRALQFIRTKAGDWGIDKDRIAGYGDSAGAQLIGYLGWANDFANSKSEDPISRESSRLKAVALLGGQSTVDLNWWVQNIPGFEKSFIGELITEKIPMIERRAIFKEISIINHISFDDPPTFMSYWMRPEDPIPTDPQLIWNWTVHHVNFGKSMQDKLKSKGVEVTLNYPNHTEFFEDEASFLIHHLLER